jgi:hypothetical protein
MKCKHFVFVPKTPSGAYYIGQHPKGFPQETKIFRIFMIKIFISLSLGVSTGNENL